MSILSIILAIVAVGVVLWLINRFIPMQSTVKSILNGLVIILLVVWLLDAFGLIDVLRSTTVSDVTP
jgi:predicted membrane protein